MNVNSKLTNKEDKILDRVRGINEIILSYAQLDFTKRAIISGEDDVIDSLAAGINMLGEELQFSTVSLQEKELLLKEIHHRVKNNLQIISSILHLQAEFSKNLQVKKPLTECQNRIKSMALLHEKLYESGDLRNIELNSYIEAISNNLCDSLLPENISVTFSRSDKDHYGHIDQLLPIGLIINELISNSLEHAFEKDAEGMIKIGLTMMNDNLQLQVKDNGCGFHRCSNELTDSLGLQLVEALVEQIDGTWSIKSDNGAVVTINFSLFN